MTQLCFAQLSAARPRFSSPRSGHLDACGGDTGVASAGGVPGAQDQVISMRVRFHMSRFGAVSLIVTVVPAAGVSALRDWTQ